MDTLATKTGAKYVNLIRWKLIGKITQHDTLVTQKEAKSSNFHYMLVNWQKNNLFVDTYFFKTKKEGLGSP